MEIKPQWVKHGVISRNPHSFFNYHGWPSVCRDDDGILYAVDSAFRNSHVCPFGKTALYRSYDNGETWSNPLIVNDTYLDDRDAGILYLGGKKLLVTWFCHPADAYVNQYGARMRESWCGNGGVLDAYPTIPEEFAQGGSFIRISEDGGNTWGDIIKLPVSSPHGPTLMKDGSLLYLGKAMYSDELPNGEVAAYRSTDGGYTWTQQAILEIPEGLVPNNFHEPHAIELPDGRIVGMIRGEGKGVAYGFTIYQSDSEDGGKTWSPMQALNTCGSPPHLMLHSSGALICSFGRRMPPHGERALVSWDGGRTWPEEYVLSEHHPCDLGYPASVELPDGEILTVYYQAGEGDYFTSLYYTKWKLNK